GVSVGTTIGVGARVGAGATGVDRTGTTAGTMAATAARGAIGAAAATEIGRAFDSAAVLGARAVGAHGAQHAAPMINAKIPPLIGKRQRLLERARPVRLSLRRIGSPCMVESIMSHPRTREKRFVVLFAEDVTLAQCVRR